MSEVTSDFLTPTKNTPPPPQKKKKKKKKKGASVSVSLKPVDEKWARSSQKLSESCEILQ